MPPVPFCAGPEPTQQRGEREKEKRGREREKRPPKSIGGLSRPLLPLLRWWASSQSNIAQEERRRKERERGRGQERLREKCPSEAVGGHRGHCSHCRGGGRCFDLTLLRGRGEREGEERKWRGRNHLWRSFEGCRGHHWRYRGGGPLFNRNKDFGCLFVFPILILSDEVGNSATDLYHRLHWKIAKKD